MFLTNALKYSFALNYFIQPWWNRSVGQLSLRWDNKHMLPVDLLPLSQYARQEVNQGGFS